MNDKKPSSDDDEQRDAEDSSPKREGNVWERQRAFQRQRTAVLRPREPRGAPPEGDRPDPVGGEGQGGAPPADSPGEYKARIKEYRRRQRKTARPAAESAHTPAGSPDPADDDDGAP